MRSEMKGICRYLEITLTQKPRAGGCGKQDKVGLGMVGQRCLRVINGGQCAEMQTLGQAENCRNAKISAFEQIGRRLALSPDAAGFQWWGMLLARAVGLHEPTQGPEGEVPDLRRQSSNHG